MSSRKIKQQVLALFNGQDLSCVLEALRQLPTKDVVNVLFSAICREDPQVRWQAISCMGDAVARLADADMEEARVIMRRLLWSLNDESGGIGWGAPECMAEIMCRQAGLAAEYVHMLLSYMREDGEEICQDGNFIEHPLLQRGLIWGVARLSQCRPDLLLQKGAGKDIPPYLGAAEAETRGLAVIAAGALRLAETQPIVQKMTTDATPVTVYQDGFFLETTVGQAFAIRPGGLERMIPPQLFPSAACVQFPISLGEPDRNMEQVAHLVDQYQPTPDTLLLLPEMWATGFAYERTVELGRRTPEILGFMQRMAAHHQVYIAGTLTALPEDGTLPFNMLYLVGPGGIIGRLPKQHLFSSWQEDRFYQGGQAVPLVETPCGPFGGLVCYDLRFPEVARRQVFAGSRLLAVSAQWPLSRLDHWQTLLRARAIENQVYVVAANGCGRTGTMEMGGHSMIIGPDGTVVQAAGTEATIIGCPLDNTLLEEQRRTFYPAGNRNWSAADNQKIKKMDNLLPELALIRRQGSRVAFTNGCFDILHAGHVSYLEEARRTADCLVVGLNADCSVRALKGPSRPVNSENDRARVLAALGCVDYVVLFEEETPIRLLTALMPDVLVKGADWPEEQIVGAAEVKAAGGRVARISFEHDRSTTALIDKIRATEQTCPVGGVAVTTIEHGEKKL